VLLCSCLVAWPTTRQLQEVYSHIQQSSNRKTCSNSSYQNDALLYMNPFTNLMFALCGCAEIYWALEAPAVTWRHQGAPKSWQHFLNWICDFLFLFFCLQNASYGNRKWIFMRVMSWSGCWQWYSVGSRSRGHERAGVLISGINLDLWEAGWVEWDAVNVKSIWVENGSPVRVVKL